MEQYQREKIRNEPIKYGQEDADQFSLDYISYEENNDQLQQRGISSLGRMQLDSKNTTILLSTTPQNSEIRGGECFGIIMKHERNFIQHTSMVSHQR